MTPVYLHVDMDAFYASVEQRDDLSLRGRPVIVGAQPGQRGVVSACSYEARRFGVHSAMPINQAYRLCPDGAFLPVRMRRYQEVSTQIMRLLAPYTPELQQMSVDEAFLDLTGTRRLLGPPEAVAREIKQNVAHQIGLTISVGVAPSRYLAKLASDADKPDGLCIVSPGEEASFVARLPLRDLWGVGKKMLSRLLALGIETVPQLKQYSRAELAELLGNGASDYLYHVCRGEDPGLYSESRGSHSISGERTFGHDIADREAVERVLLEVADNCIYRLREEGSSSRTVTLKLRLTDFSTFTLRKTVSEEIVSTDGLFREAKELLARKWDGTTPIRLVGCGLGNVSRSSLLPQGDLFDDRQEKQRRLAAAVHRLRQQGLPVKKARLIDPGPTAGEE